MGPLASEITFAEKKIMSRSKTDLVLARIILGDPGADSWGEGKSKRAEKYIWNEEK